MPCTLTEDSGGCDIWLFYAFSRNDQINCSFCCLRSQNTLNLEVSVVKPAVLPNEEIQTRDPSHKHTLWGKNLRYGSGNICSVRTAAFEDELRQGSIVTKADPKTTSLDVARQILSWGQMFCGREAALGRNYESPTSIQQKQKHPSDFKDSGAIT